MRLVRGLALASLVAAAANACASLLGVSEGVVADGGIDGDGAGDDGNAGSDAIGDGAVDARAPGDDARMFDGLGNEGTNGPPCSSTDYRRVFVTSRIFSPTELKGIAGANAICQDAAPPGKCTWVAWLSDLTSEPNFWPGAYKLVDDTTLVASDPFMLTSGTLAAPIDEVEDGGKLDASSCSGGAIVWTDTTIYGHLDDMNACCTNWDSTVGNGKVGCALESNSYWTAFDTSACGSLARIYCFEGY